MTASRKRKRPEIVVEKGQVYLSNDKAERKASGSYYTPDAIVEYIVAQTVGPVLNEKLEALRPEFRKVRKTFDNEIQKSKAYPSKEVKSGSMDHRQWAGLQTYNAHKDLVERLFDLRVLDPAMGSGHFLVEVVDFVTDRLLKFLNQFPINPVNFALDRTRQSILDSLGEQGVTVDPARLTDINLLKRHVLKRCIYGVDLNPMAVELAKVSLWLDAFTLGAPLNFLDHHLRCGNSLIGATFKELEQATATLFALNYEPLLRAINHVLFVSKMADATAGEVAASVSRYDQARQALAGYQIVLDFLVARHFGLTQAAHLVHYGSHLDLTDRQHFYASLHDGDERKLVAQVEALAQRPDRRFFHWEIEFPEVFFGFVDANERQIRHKDRLQEGSAGFDVIVGNPPYVRQETIKPLKAYLKTCFQTYDSTNDLYVYFQEMEIRNLGIKGRMGMIVANKWMRAGYGEKLRDFLQRTGQPLEVIDFGHSPIFPDADTFPCILVATKRPCPLTAKDQLSPTETMDVCEVPRENWHDRMDLGVFVSGRRHAIPTGLLRKEGWSLEDSRLQSLLNKIRKTGMPLRQHVGSEIYRGVLTGCNEAFYISEDTRQILLAEDPKSADLIKPQLRGQDIGRWRPSQNAVYVIFVRRGTKIQQYPAVFRHLLQFKDRLEPRPSEWDEKANGKWPGRKPGPYEWFEIQDSTAYYPLFEKPKIVVQCIGYHSRWALDEERQYVNNKTFLLPTGDPLLHAFLNSPLLWWYMWRVFPHMKDEALSIDGLCIEQLPVAQADQQTTNAVQRTVREVLSLVQGVNELEVEFATEISQKMGSMPGAKSLAQLVALGPDEFRLRIAKLRSRDVPASAVGEAVRMQQEINGRRVELLIRQLELEKELAALVEDAYGLTPEERALMRSTRPVRDPLDVLEAKIRGGQVDANVEEPGEELL